MGIDSPSLFEGYGGFVGGGVAAAIITQLINWFLNRKRDNAQTEAVIADATGKTGLIEALEARVLASETRQTAQDGRIKELEDRIAIEIDLRLKSQEDNHKLRLRVTELEYAIRQANLTIPEWNK